MIGRNTRDRLCNWQVRDVDVADESAGFLVDDTLSISVIVRV